MSGLFDTFAARAQGLLDVAGMGAGAFAGKHGHGEQFEKVFGGDSLASKAAMITGTDVSVGDRAHAVEALGGGGVGGAATGAAMALSGGLSKLGLGDVADTITPDKSMAGEVATMTDSNSKWGDKFEAALGVSGNELFGKDKLNSVQSALQGQGLSSESLEDMVPDNLGSTIESMVGDHGGHSDAMTKVMEMGPNLG